MSSSQHDWPVRYLRRRLLRAFQEEDVDSAIRAYTATRADLETWEAQERATAEQELLALEAQQREKKRQGRPAALKRLGSWRRSSKGSDQTLSSRSVSNHRLSSSQRRVKSDSNLTNEPDYTGQSCVLQAEMDPSEFFVPDDFKSPFESHDDEEPFVRTADRPVTNQRTGRRSMVPRMALGLFGRRRNSGCLELENISSSGSDSEDGQSHTTTTPLHEAARLGSGTLVRLMLANRGDPNERNGKLRTALHMAVGGLTGAEEDQLLALLASEGSLPEDVRALDEGVGIRAPLQDVPPEESPSSVGAKKAAKAVGRFFKQSLRNRSNEGARKPEAKPLPKMPVLDMDRIRRYAAERLDTFLAIMSWVHPEDGSPSAGEGTSMNSVDARGRTALHYAAELGRDEICMAVLSSFGTMLTVVDESSRTPCELAGEQGFHKLAAQLEARALLYVDPYGLDDDLMASVLAGNALEEHEEGEGGCDSEGRPLRHATRNLAPPFCWFETWHMEEVQREREWRVNHLLELMRCKIREFKHFLDTSEFLMSHGIDDSIDSHGEVALSLPSEQTPVGFGKECGGNMLPTGTQGDSGNGFDTEICPDSSENVDELSVNHPGIGSDGEIVDNKEQREDISGDKDSALTFPESLIQENHVEYLLTCYNWDIDVAYQIFSSDPETAMKRAGVNINLSKPIANKSVESVDVTKYCLVCCEEFAWGSPDWRQLQHCPHEFCKLCLGEYIAEHARTRSTGLMITCPHHECSSLLSSEEILDLVSDMTVYETIVQTANENFVTSAPDLKYCPHPGCQGIVKRFLPKVVISADIDPAFLNIVGAVCTACSDDDDGFTGAVMTYEGVRDQNYYLATNDAKQPRRAHRFCFACSRYGIHWPAPCEVVDNWNAEVEKQVGESEKADEKYEDVAQRLWIKANTRPCPKCLAPIEKNDGCNHMTCTNRSCRHEFCWICRKDWKLHNTQTGGFFRCNRWQEEDNDTPPSPEEERILDGDDTSPAEQQYGTALHSSIVAARNNTEMNRFLHHYRRWNAHAESAALERTMAETVCSRLAPVIDAAIDFDGREDFNFGGKGLSFVHAAFTELLECRSVLQHSYAFAFYRYPRYIYIRRNRPVRLREREKMTFEQFQADLEIVTEHLSDIVARSHLRATQTQIMFLTSGAAEKRGDFTTLMLTILNDEASERHLSERERQAANDSSSNPFESPPANEEGESRPRVLFVPQGRMRPELFPATAVRAGLSLPSQPFEQHADVDEGLEALMRAARMPITLQPPPDENTPSDIMVTTEYPWTQWSCPACTYMNIGGGRCAMCNTSRS